jgi:hypothetical protein
VLSYEIQEQVDQTLPGLHYLQKTVQFRILFIYKKVLVDNVAHKKKFCQSHTCLPARIYQTRP